jgi:aerobic carbon-monoxide dehydrogenase medium subunit
VDQAIGLLAAAGGGGMVLAGGQSLLPLLNLRMARPEVLIDIGRLAELEFVKESDGAVAIGAVTTQRAAELSAVIASHCPLIAEALHHVGHLQIRNRGTIGGSLAHADPSAELPCALVALDATVTVRGPGGTREVAAADFVLGPYTTVLDDDEILMQVTVPVTRDRAAYAEFARRDGDFAIAGVAATCGLDPATGAVQSARLVATGVGSTPQRLQAAEAVLAGAPLQAASIAEAARAAAAETDPPSDAQADSGYRRTLVTVLLTQALEAIINDH